MLKERGIAFVSLEEPIDTGSAAGKLVFHVFGAIAHFERRRRTVPSQSASGRWHPGRGQHQHIARSMADAVWIADVSTR